MLMDAPIATAGYSSGIAQMTAHFGVSQEVGQVGLFVFNAAFSIVPLFLGPLSEFIGAAPVYLTCYAGLVPLASPTPHCMNLIRLPQIRHLLYPNCSGQKHWHRSGVKIHSRRLRCCGHNYHSRYLGLHLAH